MKTILLILAGYVAGYLARPAVQDANDLLRVGFTIIDPEGYPVRTFQ